MDFQLTGREVLDALKAEGILKEATPGFENLTFTSIAYDSREARPGTLFICKGQTFKAEYLQAAAAKGALAGIWQTPVDGGIPGVTTTNIRRAMACVAAAFYQYHPGDFKLTGITGTKGKSTTLYFLKDMIRKATGKSPAWLSTVDIFDGRKAVEATLTTPEPPVTYSIFARAKANGCDHVVMECSSQSHKMDRLAGMTFDYGIFVNITQDHIAPNEHKDFAEYLACKMAIVARYKKAVINIDDAHAGDALAAASGAEKVLTYSLKADAGADIYAKDIARDGYLTHFTVVTPDWQRPVTISIPGVYNVSNALAAFGVAYLMGLDPDKAAAAIRDTQVDGRMEIYEKDGYIAVVDYAHNKASIHAAYEALQDYFPGRKIQVLFGCPGCKAFGRRRDMAEESADYCDKIYISTEDPSYKDPMDVAKEIEGYVKAKGGRSEIILDRAEAVRTAIARLKKDEILLIAGKGSEHYQLVDGEDIPYEGDTVLAAEAIAAK